MSLKDLFNRSSQLVVSSSAQKLSEDVESPEYIQEYDQEQNRIEPHIDFSDPANFSKYGSAEEYYLRSLEYIYDEYPYDGSLKERLQWKNEATLLDLYILDNKYPKSTGYAVFASDGWGTLAGSIVNGYGQPASSNYEYINIKGGPNSSFGSSLGTASLADIFDTKSNVFDQTITGSTGVVSAQRVTNLQTNLDRGVTVEFWLKTGSLDTALTEKQVVFDMWNGQASSSADYGRLRIEVDGTRADSPFMVTVLSGTVGLSTSSVEIGSTLNLNSFSDWQHYAFSFVNSGTNIETKLYVNGSLIETKTTGSNIGEIREDLEANIGALVTGTFNPSGDAFANLGSGKLSGSLDEFRFWKTRRTEKQIKRNYFTSDLGGGTNTDTANLDLGVYFKFNEGITTDATTDSVVLDYSGRISNGTWTGYPSSNARNTGSAIVSASVGTEELDVIVRRNHPDVYNLRAELQASGSLWDNLNNSSLFYTLPSWVIEEDEGNGATGNIKKLTQIMSSYLDNLDLLIGELPKFNMASYPSSSVGLDGQPDKLHKVYPYAKRAVQSYGLDAPELFSNGDVLEYYRNRNETKEFEENLSTVKNIIYNNIYNNLTDIYKAKGTEKSFRNLIRCFGVGEDVIRINAYADNDTYKFETKRRASSVRSKAINLNHVDNFAGTVYQYADSSNPNSVSHISGSGRAGLTLEDGFPITLEAEAIFPHKISRRLKNSFTQEYPHLTASLFGMHQARANSPTETDLTWAATDNANFQVFAIRDETFGSDVKFMLSSSVPFPIPELTSSQYYNVYENQKWNFAVRIKPNGWPHSLASGSLDGDYTLEFYGVNYIADRKINEFTITGSLTKQVAESFLTSPKRIYVGSHNTNFTGSTLQFSDAQITSCRYWFDYIDNETMRTHAIDPDNFGHSRPSADAYIKESDFPNIQVPEIETLALYWDFQSVTGSNNGSGSPTTFDGKFVVEDVTSGSLGLIGRYNWLGKILKYQHTGRGDGFPINSTGSVENLYLYSGKQQLPEVVFGDDNIRVLNQEETEVFTRETRPTKTYYAFEKSMYQVISDEIINYFGSIADFNNLIGEPVNRYRQEYKSLNYLKQFFFERVGNTPDLDKFVSFYKWLDSTLETMLMQLVPASAQVSDGIDNVVESHILERNKYHSKFPTLEFNVPEPTGALMTINRHLYNWKFGHRPVSGLQSDNCFYWNQRHRRDDAPLSSSNRHVNADRNKYLTASLEALERSYSTPYKYTAVKQRTIHGGINYSEGKKIHFYRGVNFPHGAKTPIGIPVNTLQAYDSDVIRFEDCADELVPNQKKKYSFGTFQGNNHSGAFDGLSGQNAMPFNLYSASEGMGGYNQHIQELFMSGSQLVNLHSDGYGNGQSFVPMQGPFTEKYVGGHQSRHIRLNNYDASRVGGDGAATPNNLDAQYSRPEAWRILLGGGPAGLGALGLTGPDYGGPYPDPTRYRAWFFREETAKRPVNIRNILQTTASVDVYLSGVLQHGPVGNYDKTYQVVQSSGRSTNNFWFNDGQADLLPAKYITNNPKTTNVHTLVGIRPYYGDAGSTRGNTFIPGAGSDTATANTRAARSLSNRYEPFQNAVATNRTVFPLPDRTKQDAIIVERFSAPGGPEINSLGFLDVVAAEKSAYNALPFRNLSVRGSGSGEDPDMLISGSSMRVVDHTGHRRGLRTLAALHAGPFGSDGTYGGIDTMTYSNTASFYKFNRNTSFRINLLQEPGDPDPSDPGHGMKDTFSTGSTFDNFYIQHPIPQNDFQYAWISASYSGSRPINHAPRSGFVSGAGGQFLPAINFVTASIVSGASGTPVTFVGLNTLFRIEINRFNSMHDTNTNDMRRTDRMERMLNTDGPFRFATVNNSFAPAKINPKTGVCDGHVLNAYIHHQNQGAQGWNSYAQVNVRFHPLVRLARRRNRIQIFNPILDTNVILRKEGAYRGYQWGPEGLRTNDQVFGIDRSSGRKEYEVNRDVPSDINEEFYTHTCLQFTEPAVMKNTQPLEFNGFVSGVPVQIKAGYSNQKTNYFVNSKLNNLLELDEKGTTAADITFGMFSNTANELKNVTYSETVFPSRENSYATSSVRRTFGSTFWRFNRRDRVIQYGGNNAISSKAGNSPFNANAPVRAQATSPNFLYYTGSMWPLDARFNFEEEFAGGLVGACSPGVKVARHDFNDDGTRGSGTGILQNTHTIFHGMRTGDPSAAPIAQQVITASCLYNRPHGLVTGSSTMLAFEKFNTAPDIRNKDAIQFTGDAPWDAPRQRAKRGVVAANPSFPQGDAPFYNSYQDYIEQMRHVGRDYSIIPEYRMSTRMRQYLIDGVNPFEDPAFLSLTGAMDVTYGGGLGGGGDRRQTNRTAFGYNGVFFNAEGGGDASYDISPLAQDSARESFFRTYSHSDFMKYFGVIKDDIETKTDLPNQPTQLTLRCSALLKLLPYDGFYPANRAVQLSRMFSASCGKGMTLSMGATTRRKQAAIRPFYAPMIAPGVLFNTIKAGIAVDYPVLTASTLMTAACITDKSLANQGEYEPVGPYSYHTASDAENCTDYYINNDFFDYRVPFEALAEPAEHIANMNFFDMEPHPSASLPATASWNGTSDDRYKLAMNNFLAEIPEFFLEDQNFTSFVSAPEEKFAAVKAGENYTMRVTLRRTVTPAPAAFDDELKRYPYRPANATASMVMYSRPSAFGPPVMGALSGNFKCADEGCHVGYTGTGSGVSAWSDGGFQASGSQFGGSAYGHNGPFTPPYFEGAAYVNFVFTPTEDKKYTLDEIQSMTTASFYRFPGWNTGTFGHVLSASGPMGNANDGTKKPDDNAMQISASVNLFGKISSKDLFKFQNVNLDGGARWAIQTKFETPILNFVEASGTLNIRADHLTTIVDDGILSGGATTRPYGMWHQYGRIPEGDEGIFLEISQPQYRDSTRFLDPPFSEPVADAPKADKSLLDLVGFKSTSKRLGRVAASKTISEAVVAVPFVEVTKQDDANPGQITTERKFFKLQSKEVTDENQAQAAIISDSVQKTLDALTTYVFPPSFDFIHYPGTVEPITMYVFEFKHTLSQKDLVDIWQNLPPKISRAFDSSGAPSGGNTGGDFPSTREIVQTKEVTHLLQDGELLSDLEEKMQWMLFKVKQRAKTNYFDKVIEKNATLSVPTELKGDGLGASLGKRKGKKQNNETDFLAGGAAKGAETIDKPTTLTYNWPYDFFSLVELVKLEQDVVFGTPEPVETTRKIDKDKLQKQNGTIKPIVEAKATVRKVKNANEALDAVKSTLSPILGGDGDQSTQGDGGRGGGNIMQVVESETKTKINASRNRIERTAKSQTRELPETPESEEGNSSGNSMQVYSEGNGQGTTLYKSSEPLTMSGRQINWSKKPNSVGNGNGDSNSGDSDSVSEGDGGSSGINGGRGSGPNGGGSGPNMG
mgnify:CR=1 FL=1